MRNILIILFLSVSSLFSSIYWYSSHEEAVKKATVEGKPLLMYFYARNHKESSEFSLVIQKGIIDFLEWKFIMAQINVSNAVNKKLVSMYRIEKVPLFVLRDFHSKRKLPMEAIAIEPIYIIKGLFEVYYEMGINYLNAKDYETSRDCFKLINVLPNEFGERASKSEKDVDKLALKNGKSNSNEEFYFEQASLSVKSGNFDKAYLYFEKVIEIAPKSKLAKKAKLEIEKISDLVDKSKFLKKKDTKGSEK